MKDVNFAERITPEQQQTKESLCDSFRDVLIDIPGTTNLGKHKIELTSSDPTGLKQYPISFYAESIIREEVEKMLQLNVIEPSSSPYSAPIVLARNRDRTNRFCIDFRKLKNITVSMQNQCLIQIAIFTKLTGKRYVTKIDLRKGYWHVPMENESKPLTAFSTRYGLYQFRTMRLGYSLFQWLRPTRLFRARSWSSTIAARAKQD